MKKPTCKLTGENGNVFNLISLAARALKQAGLKAEANRMATEIFTTAKSYAEALNIIQKYVEVE